MPRDEITTTWSSRTLKDYLLQESLWKLLLEDGSWALLLESSINTLYNTRDVITTNWN